MRNTLIALATSSVLALSSAAFADTVACSNADGFQVKLELSASKSLGTLTYGIVDDLTTVEGVETSLVQGLGAAVKGPELVFVITPAQDGKQGELVLAGGTTYRVSCK